jgi:PTH1 family peptidyl-tRNA hydrolase
VHLVVGLGNPGERYAATRHNVAWRVLDELEKRWPGEDQSAPGRYQGRRVKIRDRRLELMRPQTYMNLSGEAVAHWLHEHENEGGADDLLVVADDVYLPVGTLRLRARGASGGHRGLESIESTLGGREFARLRIGVGAAETSAELKEHVLSAFGSEEEPMVESVVQLAADAVECWANDGIETAMNRFNRRVGKEVSEP